MVGASAYMPMSYVCDTGSPMGLYLSQKAYQNLKQYDRIELGDAGIETASLQQDTAAGATPSAWSGKHHGASGVDEDETHIGGPSNIRVEQCT